MEEVFAISGRGTGVTGTIEGELLPSASSGWIDADGSSTAVTRITVELVRRHERDTIALVLHGVDRDEVPLGAVVRSEPAYL